MARSFSTAKLISAAAADGLSLSIFRRGFAAAPQALLYAREGSRIGVNVMGKMDQRAAIKPESGDSSAWTPDPVTGYYRPGNHTAEIDPVELREMLLNQKGRSH
ncbi:hypothetical protein SLE2022_165680 [Rubroshorea leprosula]